MHTTSGPPTNLAQRLVRLGVPLLLVLTLALLVALVVLAVIAAEAAGTASTPIIVAPFRW